MSKHLKPSVYGERALQNQWINTCCGNHDLFCGCGNPIKHLKDLLKERECLHTIDAATSTETGGIDTKEEMPIDDGDLAKLFDEIEDDQNG